MKRLTTDELRKSFLDFFIARAHALVPSDSLVPTYDPSLLFTGAGMNQFKDEFLGKGQRPLARACSSQKCIRTGDIGNVGVTPAHHTFFEMLGNFSFGDYFKKEAIQWGWEFVTQVLEMPVEKLSVSVYQDDDEAYGLWREGVGLPASKIYRFGAHDNFWPADAPAESPPGQLCGPCSEIFFDLGPNDCRNPDCSPACDCRRHVEIWNLVFQQFEKGAKPNELHELPRKNIDTGAGLERMAAVLQGVKTNFEIDIFLPLVEEVLRIADQAAGRNFVRRYAEQRQSGTENRELLPALRCARRIADHARAVTFCLSDGVLPANEGRGYVVRRLLRRAVLDGRALGVEESFVYSLVAPVAGIMGEQYPEVRERRENLARLVKAEEENFRETLADAKTHIEEIKAEMRRSGQKVLSGKAAFKLYDTYGIPRELIEEEISTVSDESSDSTSSSSTSSNESSESSVDWDEFEEEMEEQRERARAGSKMVGTDIFGGVMAKVKGIVKEKTGAPKTVFERMWAEGQKATILAIVKTNQLTKENELVSKAGLNDVVQIVLDRTPFYAEAGGQVGDTGELTFSKGAVLVNDTNRADDIFLHCGKVTGGAIHEGDALKELELFDRRDVEANHTATHILHHYLRQVLGKHVEQAGSLVDRQRLRLDFTHFEAMKPEEIRRVEELVNKAIQAKGSVTTEETTVEDARKKGAMALFGEKYGEKVRMVTTDLGSGERSIELCGGTHLEKIEDAHCFRIEKEESVAAGIRRITATTRTGAGDSGRADKATLVAIYDSLGLGPYQSKGDSAGLDARDRLDKLCAALKCQREALKDRVAELVKRAGTNLTTLPTDEVERIRMLLMLAKEADKREQSARASDLAGRGKEIAAAAAELPGGAKFASAQIDGLGPDDLRRLADEVRAHLPSGVIFLASNAGGKALLVAAVSDDLIKKGVKAGDLVKAAAKEVGGGGGGKPNMAQAGGPNAAGIPAAIEAARKTVGSRR